MSEEVKPIFGIRGTNGIGYCIAYDKIDSVWVVYEMPSKLVIKRYKALPKAFARVGSECEAKLRQEGGASP